MSYNMETLELILEQEHDNNIEGFLVYYSFSDKPNTLEPMEMSFGAISDYADSLNKQYGIPSSSIKPQTPSSAPTAKTFNPVEVINSLNNTYNPSVSEEEIAYYNSLNQQFNAPSVAVKPTAPSSAPTPQTFDPGPIIEAAKHPICPSLNNKPLTVPSTPIKHPAYIQPQIKTPEPIIPKLEPIKFEPIKPLPVRRPEIKYYENFKKEHRIRFSGLNSLEEKEHVYDLFKKNELPDIYDKVSRGLRIRKEAVKTITFTNPLRNEEDFSPSFTPWKRELRIPAIKPRYVAFDPIPQKEYNKMLNNAFLPHELGHAKIEDRYPEADVASRGLRGFNEHLADAMALGSVKNIPQFPNTREEAIEFENIWATKPKDEHVSAAEKGYCRDIISTDASFIPGKQATINMLGDELLKRKYDNILRTTLEARYGDDPHKETVYSNINELSNIYQEKAIKLLDLSKRNSFASDFKAKRIWSEVEKRTHKFLEDLK